jgi:hypothetical protein
MYAIAHPSRRAHHWPTGHVLDMRPNMSATSAPPSSDYSGANIAVPATEPTGIGRQRIGWVNLVCALRTGGGSAGRVWLLPASVGFTRAVFNQVADSWL